MLLQFIILTHDDAITAATDANIRAVITNHKNKNGCNMCERLQWCLHVANKPC